MRMTDKGLMSPGLNKAAKYWLETAVKKTVIPDFLDVKVKKINGFWGICFTIKRKKNG